MVVRSSLFCILILSSLLARSQEDSIQYGRYFIGVDVAPLAAKLIGEKHSDMFVQLKWVSMVNPCIRYRAAFSDYQRDGKNLLFTTKSKNVYSEEAYSANYKKSGSHTMTTWGGGVEKVFPMKKFSWIVGSDAVFGRRVETQNVQLVGLTTTNDSIRESMESDYNHVQQLGDVTSIFVGLAPSAGIEKEISNRLSMQLSLRAIAGYNMITNNELASFPSMYEVKNKMEVHLTGINLFLYYRF